MSFTGRVSSTSMTLNTVLKNQNILRIKILFWVLLIKERFLVNKNKKLRNYV